MNLHPLVIFDADETLWAMNEIYRRVLHQAIDIIGNNFLQQKKVLFDLSPRDIETIFKSIDGAREKTLSFSISRFEESLIITYALLTGYIGVQYSVDCESHLRNTARGIYAQVPKVWDDTVPGLKKFHKHAIIAALTKGDPKIQAKKFTETGLEKYFDAVFVTSQKGKETYEKVLKIVDEKISPFSNVWVVGNSIESDLKPAKEVFGLNCIWIIRLGDEQKTKPWEGLIEVKSLEDAFEEVKKSGKIPEYGVFSDEKQVDRMEGGGLLFCI